MKKWVGRGGVEGRVKREEPNGLVEKAQSPVATFRD